MKIVLDKCICKQDMGIGSLIFKKNKEYIYKSNIFIEDMCLSVCYTIKINDVEIIFDYKSFNHDFEFGMDYQLHKAILENNIINL